jgi:hypothetical protein
MIITGVIILQINHICISMSDELIEEKIDELFIFLSEHVS